MGNNKFKLTKLALALGLTASLTACFSDNDNNDYVEPVIPTPTQDVALPPTDQVVAQQPGSLTVVVRDIKGEPVGTEEAPVTITLSGSSSDVLLGLDGEALPESLTISNGSGLFAAAVTDISSELTYKVNVKAPGYFTNNTVIVVNDEESNVNATVKLTPRDLNLGDVDIAVVSAEEELTSLAADGVEVNYTDGTIQTSDNMPLTFTRTVDKEEANTDAGGVTVSIPSGSQMLDANNEPLTSAPKLAVSFFSNEATTTATAGTSGVDSTLDYFPGGLNLAVPVDGNTTQGAFTTGGFVAIELTDEDGNKVKKFGDGNSIEVTMQVDKNTNNVCPMVYTGDLEDVEAFATASANATNGAYFQDGACVASSATKYSTVQIDENHIIPVWSYDEDLDEWTFESYGVTKENADNPKVWDVVVSVNHLSYWNLDYFNWREPNFGQCANNKATFDIKFNDGTSNTIPFDLLVESQAGGYRVLKSGYEFSFYDTNTIYNPPAFAVNMQFLNDGENIIDGIEGDANNLVDNETSTLKIDDICALEGKTIVLNTAPILPVAQPVKTSLVCNNEEADVLPAPTATSSIVYFYQSGAYKGYAYTDSSGNASKNLLPGDYTASAYNFTTGQYSNLDFTASASETVNIEFPVTCEVVEQPITGSGSGS
ncbi:hypothetical protein [Pseudoalteromonas sp. SaAl2]